MGEIFEGGALGALGPIWEGASALEVEGRLVEAKGRLHTGLRAKPPGIWSHMGPIGGPRCYPLGGRVIVLTSLDKSLVF